MDVPINLALQKCGYTELRPHQEQVIHEISQKKDCLFCAPTGSGKSLIFEVSPFLLFNIDSKISEKHDSYENCLTIVVSPLVALMKSQANELNDRGISALYLGDIGDDTSVTLTGVQALFEETDGAEEPLHVMQQKKTMEDLYEGKINLLLASPESFLSKGGRKLLKKIGSQMVKCLVVDEAHCIAK
jgi:superfamily II DNA helicase RecQ